MVNFSKILTKRGSEKTDNVLNNDNEENIFKGAYVKTKNLTKNGFIFDNMNIIVNTKYINTIVNTRQ